MLNSFNLKVIAVAAVCGPLGVADSSAKATVFQSNDLPSGSILLAENEENSLTPDPLLDNDTNLDKANDTGEDQKVEADKQKDAKSQALSVSEQFGAELQAEHE